MSHLVPWKQQNRPGACRPRPSTASGTAAEMFSTLIVGAAVVAKPDTLVENCKAAVCTELDVFMNTAVKLRLSDLDSCTLS
jgi:hypothetical protein